VTVFVPQLYRRASLPQQLQFGAVVGYAAVFSLLLAFPDAGIGIPQAFYVPIVLASLSGGPGTGATAGVVATLLYEATLRANGVGSLAASAPVHLLAYVAAGTIVGYFARRTRGMLAEALNLLEQMLHVARHDVSAEVLSSSGLETAISRRIAEDEQFGLLIGEVSGGGGDLLQTAQRAIELRNGETVVVGRVGPTQLAVVVSAGSSAAVQREATELEQLLERHGCRATFGWAVRPAEGDDALSLCRAASERLYARRYSQSVQPAAA
jgi:hypothetical protein